MIWVNFKNYEEGQGEAAERLVAVCRRVSQKTGTVIMAVVPATEIFRLKGEGVPIWGQHVDGGEGGAVTGAVLASGLVRAGAEGVILNHSERPLAAQSLAAAVTSSRKAGLKVLICCRDLAEGKRVAELKPDFLAYEPPDLIGNRQVSVAQGREEEVKAFGESFDLPIVIGAGVRRGADIKQGLALGAKGFLVASAVVLAREPEEVLTELAAAFQ